ncbi:MAG: DUF3526 domain-containing protein, partial [Bacteroidetes bacterium]|nr:DUF3526 domain-containing protein [Bacteroidota bacterium]
SEVFPEARHSAYVQDTVRDPLIDRHYYDAAGLLLSEAAAAEVVATEAGRERLARQSTWYNPAYAMQMGLDAIAGNSSAAYLAFNADISAAVKAKVAQLLAFALAKEPVDAEKFQVLRQTVGPNPNYAGQVPGISWLVLLLYTVLIGGMGAWRLRKG